jgi:hypothetical protein
MLVQRTGGGSTGEAVTSGSDSPVDHRRHLVQRRALHEHPDRSPRPATSPEHGRYRLGSRPTTAVAIYPLHGLLDLSALDPVRPEVDSLPRKERHGRPRPPLHHIDEGAAETTVAVVEKDGLVQDGRFD